jgi:hypothetical protein
MSEVGRTRDASFQIALVPASTGTTLVPHEEHLADAVEREARREHWQAIADELAAAVDRHASGAH